MTNENLPVTDRDQQSRDRIRGDIGTNFFVEAGAGSGKTSLLVDRMIAMVEGGIGIDKICAITFTKAAAAEFYRRFQKKLSETTGDPAKDALRRSALKNLDLCFMGTIDAFCNLVISEHPTEAGVPANTALVQDRSAYYLREYTRIARGEYGPDLQAGAQRFRHVAGRRHQSLFTESIKIFADWRGHDIRIEELPADTLDACLGEKKTKLIGVLRYLKEHPECLMEKSTDCREAKDLLLKHSDVLFDDWDKDSDAVSALLKSFANLRIVPEYSDRMTDISPDWEHYFKEHFTRTKLAWYEAADENDPFLYQAVKNIRFAEVASFLRDAAAALKETLTNEGLLTFHDYLILLRDLLKKDAAGDGRLIRHISERHSYFLIDEFQDTNPVQAEIFFYLTAQQPQPDWRACCPKAGSLFMVGDPKQSIYRFQGADVESFERVKALFTGDTGKVLPLSRNFRSTAPLCAWFNRVFPALLSGNTAFEPIPPDGKAAIAASLSGTYRYEIRYAQKVDDRREYDDTAALIDRLVRDPSVTIQAAGGGSMPRRVEYGDIMLITPTKNALVPYMQALTARRIPFFVEGAVDFDRCPALPELALLLEAAADPRNKTVRFAAENMSLCRPSEDRLPEYARRARTLSPAALAELLLDAEQIFAHTGTENAELLYYALELLRNAQTDGTVSTPGEAAGFLRSLSTRNAVQERYPQLIQSGNRVHLANLHKVKGLEAPVVILASPHGKEYPPGSRTDRSGDRPQTYPFVIDSYKTNAFPKEMDDEKKALEKERVRLLYVAATRAESALLIADCRDAKGERKLDNPWLPLLEKAEQDYAKAPGTPSSLTPLPDPEELSAEDAYAQASATSLLPLAEECSAESYQLLRPSSIKLPSKWTEEEPAEEAAQTLPAGRKNAALIGTMVHRLMELIVSSRGAIPDSEAVLQAMREQDAESPEYRSLLEKVAATMRGGGYPQSGSAPQDLLAELLSADQVFCELPFCRKTAEGDVWHGVMDVVYCKDGCWRIVDYKTNADGSDLDTIYAGQLQAYKEAFRAITGEEAEVGTYHVEV